MKNARNICYQINIESVIQKLLEFFVRDLKQHLMVLERIVVYKKTIKLTYFFFLKIETMALHLTKSKNLLFAGKNTVINILLFFR